MVYTSEEIAKVLYYVAEDDGSQRIVLERKSDGAIIDVPLVVNIDALALSYLAIGVQIDGDYPSRPSASVVLWIGVTEPPGALDGDIWIEVS